MENLYLLMIIALAVLAIADLVVGVSNDAVNFLSGYAASDVNGDDSVDLTDLTIIFNNTVAYVAVIRP